MYQNYTLLPLIIINAMKTINVNNDKCYEY